MDVMYKEKTGRKGLISTTWQRCKSIGRKTVSFPSQHEGLKTKSQSWPRMSTTVAKEEENEAEESRSKRRVAPEGCFSVYVGDQRERFVVKAEYANHPLFRILLDEAESEYGYSSQGPLWLPCRVDIFRKVLLEMDTGYDGSSKGCGHPMRHASFHLLSPSRAISQNHFR